MKHKYVKIDIVTGIRKELYDDIIGYISVCTEATEQFNYIKFKNQEFLANYEDIDSCYDIHAVAKLIYDEEFDSITWVWNFNVASQVKKNMSEEEWNELKYYFRNEIVFHISHENVLHLLRGMAIKYLEGTKYAEYSSNTNSKNKPKESLICVYNENFIKKKQRHQLTVSTNGMIFVQNC